MDLSIRGGNGFYLCICSIGCGLDDMGNFIVVFLLAHTLLFSFSFYSSFWFFRWGQGFFFSFSTSCILYDDVHRFEGIGSFVVWLFCLIGSFKVHYSL